MGQGMNLRNAAEPSASLSASLPAVTLATTDKMLYPSGWAQTGLGFFYAGKLVKLTGMGSLTTAATPGNGTWSLYYGTTDAGGTLLASTPTVALTASRTTKIVTFEIYVRCHGTGLSGSGGKLTAWGKIFAGTTSTDDLIPSPFWLPMPANTPVETSIDTTISSALTLQMKRTGSTAESFTMWDVVLEEVND